MKCVLMAGGYGKRLRPCTDPLNKQALPIYDRPLIHHDMKTLTRGGVSEVLILLNGQYPGVIVEQLGDGSDFGLNIYYRYTRTPVGVCQHLLMAERWTGDQPFVFMLGDSFFAAHLPFTEVSAPHMFVMPLSDLDDPSKYGQVTFEDGHVTRLVEKPTQQISEYIQTGAWVLPPDIYDKIRHWLAQGHQGELHIGQVLPEYVAERRMSYTMLPPQSYVDCGTYESLLTAALLASGNL
jgi:glucose-1-phosphate thymidylyltransferase